jgi:hypothetical protein
MRPHRHNAVDVAGFAEVLGIAPPGFYAVFGSKAGLSAAAQAGQRLGRLPATARLAGLALAAALPARTGQAAAARPTAPLQPRHAEAPGALQPPGPARIFAPWISLPAKRAVSPFTDRKISKACAAQAASRPSAWT